MQCHYCDRNAEVEPEYEGVKVGLCKVHLQETLAEFTPNPPDEVVEAMKGTGPEPDE